jgi:hypothetical protein
MSRSADSQPSSRRAQYVHNVARGLILATRHVACMVLGTGCLYIAPVWRPAVNLPPEIIRPEGADVRIIPLVFNTSQVLVTVIAADPEGEALEFVWQTSRPDPVVSTYPQGDEAWVSVLTLSEDDVQDGDIIRVTVFDDNPRAAIDVEWQVELP